MATRGTRKTSAKKDEAQDEQLQPEELQKENDELKKELEELKAQMAILGAPARAPATAEELESELPEDGEIYLRFSSPEKRKSEIFSIHEFKENDEGILHIAHARDRRTIITLKSVVAEQVSEESGSLNLVEREYVNTVSVAEFKALLRDRRFKRLFEAGFVEKLESPDDLERRKRLFAAS